MITTIAIIKPTLSSPPVVAEAPTFCLACGAEPTSSEPTNIVARESFASSEWPMSSNGPVASIPPQSIKTSSPPLFFVENVSNAQILKQSHDSTGTKQYIEMNPEQRHNSRKQSVCLYRVVLCSLVQSGVA